jgi:hypothetical protein
MRLGGAGAHQPFLCRAVQGAAPPLRRVRARLCTSVLLQPEQQRLLRRKVEELPRHPEEAGEARRELWGRGRRALSGQPPYGWKIASSVLACASLHCPDQTPLLTPYPSFPPSFPCGSAHPGLFSASCCSRTPQPQQYCGSFPRRNLSRSAVDGVAATALLLLPPRGSEGPTSAEATSPSFEAATNVVRWPFAARCCGGCQWRRDGSNRGVAAAAAAADGATAVRITAARWPQSIILSTALRMHMQWLCNKPPFAGLHTADSLVYDMVGVCSH